MSVSTKVIMDRTVVNPAFLRLLEHPLNVNNIRESLSTLLEGFLKNLKYNKYPTANDLSMAAIFIQNAALIYSDNVDELFTLVTELNRALYIFKPQPSSTVTPSTPNSSQPSLENNSAQEEEDEQVASSKTRKQSRKRIEEHDNDPTDITDSWTTDMIDEAQEELLPCENNENRLDFFSEQDLEVETVLAQCDNFESTSSFVCRDDVHRDKTKDVSKREYRILAQMTDDGFICTDFNIFDTKRSKRFSNIVTNTVDMLEAADFTESINRDGISLEPTSIVHSVESRENGLEDDMELDVNPHKRLDTNRKDDDEFYNLKMSLVRSDKEEYFQVSLHFLDEFSKKHMRKSMLYKYAFYRDVHYYDHFKLNDAVNLHGSTPHPIDSDTSKFYSDPDIVFEGFQTLYDAEWYGWCLDEDTIDKQESPLETSATDVVPDLDESEYVQEAMPIPKPSLGDMNKNVFTKKASKWIELWKPIVQKTTNAKKFDINEYGDKVIETIGSYDPTESPEKPRELSQKTLEDVLGTQSFQEASKYFLAVLVLANNGNLELEKSSDPLTVNKCNIKLLSQERHHEKFHQDIAIHSQVSETKKRKK